MGRSDAACSISPYIKGQLKRFLEEMKEIAETPPEVEYEIDMIIQGMTNLNVCKGRKPRKPSARNIWIAHCMGKKTENCTQCLGKDMKSCSQIWKDMTEVQKEKYKPKVT